MIGDETPTQVATEIVVSRERGSRKQDWMGRALTGDGPCAPHEPTWGDLDIVSHCVLRCEFCITE